MAKLPDMFCEVTGCRESTVSPFGWGYCRRHKAIDWFRIKTQIYSYSSDYPKPRRSDRRRKKHSKSLFHG